MYQALLKTISEIDYKHISAERITVLRSLTEFIREKVNRQQNINLNFICTHNSRRSHLSQVWAQVAALYFGIDRVFCYSGGTEVTALHAKIVETLLRQGFKIDKIADNANPVFAINYGSNEPAVIGFSKKYDHPFNPGSGFAAIMTCSQADEGCPLISGAEKRIPLTFEDPKISDGTPEQSQVYAETSLKIAAEMLYAFSLVNGSSALNP